MHLHKVEKKAPTFVFSYLKAYNMTSMIIVLWNLLEPI